MKFGNKYAVIILIAFLLLLAAVLFGPKHLWVGLRASRTIWVNAEVASTEEEQTRGLMNRTYLSSFSGMLFVFPQEQSVSFWMKDTLIPLDQICIAQGQITAIRENAPPLSTEIFSCRADRVLEVPVGFSKANGLFVGDSVVFSRLPI